MSVGVDPRSPSSLHGPPPAAASAPRRSGGLFRNRSIWAKSPLLLLRFPAILLAVFFSIVILSMASSLGPLYRSATANATLTDQLRSVRRWQAGLTVVSVAQVAGRLPVSSPFHVLLAETLLEGRDDLLHEALAGARGLGPERLSILATARAVVNPSVHRPPIVVRPFTGTGAFSHVQLISGGGTDGLWFPESVASKLALHPGDRAAIDLGEKRVGVRVAAVYRDLDTEHLTEYWAPLAGWIKAPLPDQPLPPTLILADQDTLHDLEGRVHDPSAVFEWLFPLARTNLTLEDGATLADTLQRLKFGLNDPTSRYFGFFLSPSIRTSFPDLYRRAQEVATSLQGPIESLTLTGVIVAFLVVSAAGIYWIQRRGVEIRQMAIRGIGIFALTARTWIEIALPAAAAAGAGWLLAWAALDAIGPGGLVSPTARELAGRHLLQDTVGGGATLGVVVGAGSRLSLRSGQGRLKAMVAGGPWELLPLGLAGAAFYEISSRGTTVVATPQGLRVDRLLLLFPLLFILGAAAFVARVLRMVLIRLRTFGRGRRPGLFLALRRVSAASATAVLLMVASSVALGVLVYSGSLRASLQRSIYYRSAASIGSDVALSVGGTDPVLPRGFPYPATILTRVPSLAFLAPGGTPVEILEIDPSTFPRGAFWDPSFSDQPLTELMRQLHAASGSRVPVLLVPKGAAPRDPSLEAGTEKVSSPFTGKSIDAPGYLSLHVATVLRGFPGASTNRTELIADRAVLRRAWQRAGISADLPSHPEVWAKGDLQDVKSALERSGIRVVSGSSARKIRSSPAFLALSSTFGFMSLLGVMMALVAWAGMAMYLQARQRSHEVSHALTRRMGLSSRTHGMTLLLEVAGLLLASWVVGTSTGLSAASLTFSRLDPMAGTLPPTLLRIPWNVIGLAAAALLVAAVVGAGLAQRRAGRANVAEVMRLGG